MSDIASCHVGHDTMHSVHDKCTGIRISYHVQWQVLEFSIEITQLISGIKLIVILAYLLLHSL